MFYSFSFPFQGMALLFISGPTWMPEVTDFCAAERNELVILTLKRAKAVKLILKM